ncbi:MAG: hypothetical protein ABH814_00355 [bacterium]
MFLQIFGPVTVPGAFGYAPTATGFGLFLDNITIAVFGVSGLLFFLYLLFGAFKYLTAGGDDKAVQEAKKALTHAAVGLAIVAASFLIAEILSVVLGINILQLNIP